MTVQTYCAIAEVKDLLSDHGVLLRTDDNEDGVVDGSGTESTVQSNAIERSATVMNMALQQTAYNLADLASNGWCKWCNATLAAVSLCRRRGNGIPQSLAEEQQYYKETLELLKRGILHSIPETAPSIETLPTVTNFTTEPWSGMPVRRRTATSTGKLPAGSRKKWSERYRFND